jgi:hypothetical protein
VSSILFRRVAQHHYEGDDLLEQGVLAELEGKPNPKLFRQALEKFETCLADMDALDQKMAELARIDASAKYNRAYQVALGKILRDSAGFERISLSGVRYANIAGRARPAMGKPRTGAEILAIQRKDLGLMRKQLRDTVSAFKTMLPLADKGQFSALILSGRHGFSDKIQQSVDLIGTYTKSYTRGCMTTIDATMQAFPAGLKWLRMPDNSPAPPERLRDKGTGGTLLVSLLPMLACAAFMGRRRRRDGVS